MNTTGSPRDIIKQLEEEHADLKRRLDDVRAALEDASGETDIVEVMEWFHDDVAEHFHREEADGCFDEAVSLAPRLTTKAAGLMRQHTALLEMLDELLSMVREPAQRDDVLARFDIFAAKWLHHESEENRLLQIAYNEDLGAAD